MKRPRKFLRRVDKCLVPLGIAICVAIVIGVGGR